MSKVELTQVLARYSAIESLDVQFSQIKSLKDMDIQLQSNGRLQIKPPQLVIWEILKPRPLRIELQKDQILIHSADGQQVIRPQESPSSRDRESYRHLLNWLRMDADAILLDHTARKLGPNRFQFKPRVPDSTINEVDMELLQSGHLKQLKILETSGDSIALTFSKPVIQYKPKSSPAHP